jgi:tRNA G37 N-methylase Trm5
MLFTWNSDITGWYLNASEYTGFYKNLAKEIAPKLNGFKTLCDLGCGLGLFDFEIYPLMDQIDCIDLNETALSSIQERAEKHGIYNIHTRISDCFTVSGEWDIVFMSFFGSLELDRFLPLCKKLIAVIGVTSEPVMFPRQNGSGRKNTVDDTIAYLNGKNLQYNLTYKQYEFGQPFVSKRDAEKFIRTYSPDSSDKEMNDFLTSRLSETGKADFPYYMPRMKPVGIFELVGTLR